MINPANAAALYAGNLETRPAAGPADNVPKKQDNSTEAGQTSSIGPAVVARLSAAALQSPRPVTQPVQGANANGAAEPAVEQRRDTGGEKLPETAESKRPAAIDIMV